MQPSPRKAKTNLAVPIILFVAGVALIIFAVVLALAAARPEATAATPTSDANIPFPEVARVSLEDAKQAYDSQSAVFVDTRDGESFAVGHIPGAVNIPFDQVETLSASLDKNAWIITYCT